MYILEKLNVVKLAESEDKKNKLLAEGYKLKETKPEKQIEDGKEEHPDVGEEKEESPDVGEEKEESPVSEQIEKEKVDKKNK